MSFRRRRSGDFTDSVVEYQRSVQERETRDPYDSPTSSLQNLAPEKKIMINVKSNETIPPDTTIYNKVSALRSQVNSEKQDWAHDSENFKTPTNNYEKVMSVETPNSPITDILDKISKALEIKQVKVGTKPSVETCRPQQTKLWNALATFNRTLSSNKNSVPSHQKVLTRLSQEFYSSPTKFAEKLVTIIEDSLMPSISEQKDCSGISVSRMTNEFRKLCKFIEDESMPDWIMSPDVIHEEQIENQSIEFVEDSITETSSTPLEKNCIQSSFKNAYQETPKGIFRLKDSPLSSDNKPINKVIKGFRFNDTNNSFEYWETMCNGVYLQQRVTPQGLRRSKSLPDSPTTRLNNIRTTCERQMASLDDTVIDQNRTHNKHQYFQYVAKEITFSSQSLKAETTRTPKTKKYFSEQNGEKKKIKRTERQKGKKISPKKRPTLLRKPNVGSYSPNCEDDLDQSLLAELAQRRQRCFETAKLMMEIDKNDPIISDAKETAELIAKLGSPNKSLSLSNNNVDFMHTINHCMEYQDFLLKKRQSIFNIIQHPKSSDTDSVIGIESKLKTESPLQSTLEKVDFKTPVRKVINSEEKNGKKSPRRRFFFTPGKSPNNEEVKKKKEYFPQMGNMINAETSLNFAKSPRTADIRKNIYEYVRSPVAEYIKGTDTKLVQNIQAKTNDWLLTPQPLGVSSQSNENQITPFKSIQESSALKFNLSPMKKKELGDENIPETEFKLPKIIYHSPAKVHMIKESSENESKGPGLRVKTLLKSAEKKIVIRHEGRAAVASPRNTDEDETDNKLLDTSIHVKTIARKTDSIRTRNVR